MRKQVTGQGKSSADEPGNSWIDLDVHARVEVSSEAADSPIEHALLPGYALGWQAAVSGPATVTLRFDVPQPVGRVLIDFAEQQYERSQEWALSAHYPDGSERELLRQGWNFSPAGSHEQREVLTLDGKPVVGLRLWIDPDRGQNRYSATLKAWRVGLAR